MEDPRGHQMAPRLPTKVPKGAPEGSTKDSEGRKAGQKGFAMARWTHSPRPNEETNKNLLIRPGRMKLRGSPEGGLWVLRSLLRSPGATKWRPRLQTKYQGVPPRVPHELPKAVKREKWASEWPVELFRAGRMKRQIKNLLIRLGRMKSWIQKGPSQGRCLFFSRVMKRRVPAQREKLTR